MEEGVRATRRALGRKLRLAALIVLPDRETHKLVQLLTPTQAEFTTGEEAAAKKAARSFKKYTYRGVELDDLLDLSNEAFIDVSLGG